MRLLWLADVLRDAGLTVHEYAGWRTRGAEFTNTLRGVICHATAGSRTSTDAGETRTLWVTGSTSAPAPISQLYLSRSGAWTVGASGRCNHVLVGHKGPHQGYGNSYLIGVEAQNDNRGEPWSAPMLNSYRTGVAAICRRMGWPASRVVAHREHQNGKTDPAGIDMQQFRAVVARLIEEDDMPTSKQIVDELMSRRINKVDPDSGSSPDMTFESFVKWLHKHTVDTKLAVLAMDQPEEIAARLGPPLAAVLTAAMAGQVGAPTAEQLAEALRTVLRDGVTEDGG